MSDIDCNLIHIYLPRKIFLYYVQSTILTFHNCQITFLIELNTQETDFFRSSSTTLKLPCIEKKR